MNIERISIEINDFSTIDDNRSDEVCQILLGLVAQVRNYGVVNAFESVHLKDSNGNIVGSTECEWNEGDSE